MYNVYLLHCYYSLHIQTLYLKFILYRFTHKLNSVLSFIQVLGIIYMFELVPTAVRGKASAALTFLGFLVTGFAPTLAKTDQSVALIVFGVVGVLGGLLGLALPEIAGLPLPARDDD